MTMPWDDPNPVEWVGVAIRRRNGEIEAYQFDASQLQDVTIDEEVTVETRGEYPRDRPALHQVTLTVRGVGRVWVPGAAPAGAAGIEGRAAVDAAEVTA